MQGVKVVTLLWKMTSKTLLTEERANLLISGYTRKDCKSFEIEIPTSLIELILLWFFEAFEILQFSDKYCSKEPDVFRFENNRTTVTKIEEDFHRYICVDTEPVFTGIHCWRVQFNADSSDWISFGVSECTSLYDRSFRAANC